MAAPDLSIDVDPEYISEEEHPGGVIPDSEDSEDSLEEVQPEKTNKSKKTTTKPIKKPVPTKKKKKPKKVTSEVKPAWKYPKDLNDRKKQARSENPAGVRIVENGYSIASMVAGYLGFETVPEMADWMDQPQVSLLMEQYQTVKKANFGCAAKRAVLITKTLFATLNEYGAEVKALESVSDPDPSATEWRAHKGVGRWDFKAVSGPTGIIAVHMVFYFQLIQGSPDVFTESQQIQDQEQLSVPVEVLGNRWSAEDIYRAYVFFQFLSARKPKTTDLRDKFKQFAAKIHYLEEDEDEQQVAAQVVEDNYEHPSMRFYTKEYDIEIDHQTLAMWQSISSLTAKEKEQLYERLEDRLVMDDNAEELMARRPHAEINARERLNVQDTYALLRLIGGNCDIKHESWKKDSLDDKHGTDLLSQVRRTILNSQALNESETLKDGANDKQSATDFWKARSALVDQCVNAQTYSDALRQLGLPQEEERRNEIRLDYKFMLDHEHPENGFIPNEWQISGAAAMQSAEDGPVEGGILADDCGMGKTSLVMYHIMLSAQRRESKNLPASQFPYKPTLIICPSTVIEVWISEYKQYWSGTLQLFVAYGQRSKSSQDNWARRHMIGTEGKDIRKFIKRHCNGSDPLHARYIILTSYETFQARTLTTTTQYKEELRSIKQDIANGKMIADVHPTSKNIPDGDEYIESFDAEAIDAEINTFEADIRARTAQLEELKADHPEIDKRVVFCSKVGNLFHRWVADEGHKIKNTNTRIHRAIWATRAQKKWIVTATPMLNRSSDLLGYLNVFWKSKWRRGMPILDSRADLYTYQYMEEVMNKWTSPINHDDGMDLDASPNDSDDDNDENLPIDDESATGGYYVLDPRPFCWLENHGRLTGTTARDALQSILGKIQIKRTMATVMEVYGKSIRIGDSIPPYQITTVELDMKMHEAESFKEIWDNLSGYLTRRLKSSGGHMKPKPTSDLKGLRDASIHRLLSLATFDQRLVTMIMRYKANKAKDVQTWYDKGPDAGATFYQQYTKLGRADPVYSSRFDLAVYMTACSPKLRFMCRIIDEGMNSKNEAMRGKTLFFVGWPLEQWEVTVLLDILGIKMFHLHNGLTSQEKQEMMTKFNDPKDTTPVMVCSIRSSALGLNLQHGCHRMVIMTLPDNINTILQAIGRIHRLGQKYEQYIWIVTVYHTYDQVMQGKLVKKYHNQLVGEAKLVDLVDDPEAKAWVQEHFVEEIPEDAPNVDEIIADIYLREQVDLMLNNLLGFRCSRRGWDNLELYVKDENVYAKTPTHQRTIDYLAYSEKPTVQAELTLQGAQKLLPAAKPAKSMSTLPSPLASSKVPANPDKSSMSTLPPPPTRHEPIASNLSDEQQPSLIAVDSNDVGNTEQSHTDSNNDASAGGHEDDNLGQTTQSSADDDFLFPMLMGLEPHQVDPETLEKIRKLDETKRAKLLELVSENARVAREKQGNSGSTFHEPDQAVSETAASGQLVLDDTTAEQSIPQSLQALPSSGGMFLTQQMFADAHEKRRAERYEDRETEHLATRLTHPQGRKRNATEAQLSPPDVMPSAKNSRQS